MDEQRGYGVGSASSRGAPPSRNMQFMTPMAYKPGLAQSSPITAAKEQSLKRQLGLDDSDDSDDDGLDFEVGGEDADADVVPVSRLNAVEEQLKREVSLKEDAVLSKQKAEDDLKKTKEAMNRHQQMTKSQVTILKKSFDAVNAKQQDTIDELRGSMEDHIQIIKGLFSSLRARDPGFTPPSVNIPSALSPEHDAWKSSGKDHQTFSDGEELSGEAALKARVKELLTVNAALGTALKQFEIDFSPNSSVMKDETIRMLEVEIQELKKAPKVEKASANGNPSQVDEIVKKEFEKIKAENKDLTNKLKQLKKAYITLSNKKTTAKEDGPSPATETEGQDSQEVKELQKQNKDLKKICKALQAKLAEVSAAKSPETEVKPKAETQKPSESTDPSQTEMIAKLEQYNTELMKKAKEYKAKIKVLETEIEKSKASKSPETSQSPEVVAAKAAAEEALIKETSELKKKLEAAVDKYNKLKESATKLEKELATAKTELSGSQKEGKNATAEIGQLRQNLASTEQQLRGTQSELQELKTRAKALQKLDTIVKIARTTQKQSNDIGQLFSATQIATKQAVIDMNQYVESFKKQALVKLAEYDSLLASAQQRYKKESRERRILYNQLQDLKGNIRVFVRVRPPSKDEIARGYSQAITFPDENQICVLNQSASVQKTFEFDRVFDWTFDQAGVFEDTQPLVMSVTDGYNVSIIAYGQTGSGKTHTMEGPPKNRGVNYRSLQELFGIVSTRGSEYNFEISVSYVEIYNEMIKDLLGNQDGKKLEIKQGPEGVYVPDLTTLRVNQESDIHDIMDLGKRNRSVGVTSMNEHSSRSHAVLTVYVRSENKHLKTKTSGKLTLVDLAGSERLSRSKAEGERMTEAQNINKSLSALGDVIASLSAKNSHVPYRNSKLTYLLQDCLGGDSKTLMFIQVSPAEDNAGETLCSLNFAARVKTVELGQAKKHGDDGQLVYYKRMADLLKSHIESNGIALPVLPSPPVAAKKK